MASASAPITLPGYNPSKNAVVNVMKPNKGTDSKKLTIGKIILLAVLNLTANTPQITENKIDHIIPTIMRNIVRIEKYARFPIDKKSCIFLTSSTEL